MRPGSIIKPGTVALVLAAFATAAAALAFPQPSLADPPVFTSVPQDMLVVADTSDGANVDYPAPQAIDDNGTPFIECDRQSGDTFPVGMSTVTCTATDWATGEESQ